MNAHASNKPVTDRWRNVMPYALILIVGLFCHGFILTDDSPIWDEYYWVNRLQNKNWPQAIELTEFPPHNRLASPSTSTTSLSCCKRGTYPAFAA